MIFNSIPFLLFFPIVIFIYYLVPDKYRYIWLLISSYFFYMCQSTSFVLLLLCSTIVTYVAGIVIHQMQSITLRKWAVAITVLLNAGILVFVKYADSVLGLCGSTYRFNFFIPIGISFYTLQSLSYVIDCYRQKIAPEKNMLRYALFVSFFPSILSGPINRAQDLLPELRCTKTMDLENVKCGMQKMLWGYFLKLVIAARLDIVVNTVYGNTEGYTGVGLLCGAVFYLLMLYCDFEGYSQMAIGAARILGITMKENFRQPFCSQSMGELWHRWHVSLSTWLREYVYFSLGGGRKGNVRKYINMMLIFVLSGLWHGSNPTFLIWGILNGAFLIMGNILKDTRERIAVKCGFDKRVRLRRITKRIGVFCLYCFTMIFFASESVAKAIKVITGITTRFSAGAFVNGEIFTVGLGVYNMIFSVMMVVVVLIIDGFCDKYECEFSGLMKRVPTLYRWILYYSMIILILISSNLDGREFIYSTM